MSFDASGEEYWGDGAGGARALTSDFVETTSHAVDNDNSLFLTYTIPEPSSAGSIQIRVQWSKDNSTWHTLPAVDNVFGGLIATNNPGVFDAIPIAGSWTLPPIEIPFKKGYLRVQARLVGGAASLFVEGFKENRGDV